MSYVTLQLIWMISTKEKKRKTKLDRSQGFLQACMASIFMRLVTLPTVAIPQVS